MQWEGSKIADLAKEKMLSLQKLADMIGVSRQTINDWIKGQIPKGSHLLTLSRILEVKPDIFFDGDTENQILMPSFRKRKAGKVTERTQKLALEMADEFVSILKNHDTPEIVPVIRGKQRDLSNARQIATELKEYAGISKDKPMTYTDTFRLLDELGMNPIFKSFPKGLVGYAFYTKICGHRVVFVDYHTKVVDLIFPLLHESVHAVRDEISQLGIYDPDEERFCDLVANALQFPESYVQTVYDTIKNLDNGSRVNILKSFGKNNNHTLYGIVMAIKLIAPDFELDVHGADSNFRKTFPTIHDIIFEGSEVRAFIHSLHVLSGNFLRLIVNQLESISDRKLAEIFEIEGVLDASIFRSELLKQAT